MDLRNGVLFERHLLLRWHSEPCILPLRMQAYDRAIARSDSKKVITEKLKYMKGWYRCCMYKWRHLREKQQWPLLVKACPKLCKRHKELPDFLRRFMGQPKRFQERTPEGSQATTSILPNDFIELVSQTVVSCLGSFFLGDDWKILLYRCWHSKLIYVWGHVGPLSG